MKDFDLTYLIHISGHPVMEMSSRVKAVDMHEASRLLKKHIQNKVSVMITKKEEKKNG